jgi:ATP-dependent Zn protease
MNSLPEATRSESFHHRRGMAAGYTLALPLEDRTSHPRRNFRLRLSLLGGRAAEDMYLMILHPSFQRY